MPLSREFLLSRGRCCGLLCLNCPYIPRHVEGSVGVVEVEVDELVVSDGECRVED